VCEALGDANHANLITTYSLESSIFALFIPAKKETIGSNWLYFLYASLSFEEAF
jgi:hypothetical protein